MNRLGLTLTAIFALVILLVGGVWYLWFRENGAPPEPIQQTEESQDTKLVDAGEYYDITATYPSRITLSDEDAGLHAHAVIEAFIYKEVATFQEENGVLTFTSEDIEIQNLDERKYELDISYVTYESDNTKSFVFVIYADTLGAHPNAYYRTFTFDRETGNAVTLKNLFEDGYLETLSTITRDHLINDIASLQGVPTTELDTTFIDAGTAPIEANFAWFFLQNDTLSLIFPPYQVGPWSLGTQTVNILTKDLPQLREMYR
jgi:hypothetical protein